MTGMEHWGEIFTGIWNTRQMGKYMTIKTGDLAVGLIVEMFVQSQHKQRQENSAEPPENQNK